jgi:transposase
MQDNASAHAAHDTLKDLKERVVTVIDWPPFSPDLNPIEHVWNWMKDYFQKHYPQETMTYDRLRVVVKEAWDASMPARSQAIIDANGRHTKY